MEYEDRLTVSTPEGVDIDMVVAGLGSRFLAVMVDGLLQAVAILALRAGTSFLGQVGVALFVIGVLLVFVGSGVVFEVLWAGRTPGKRAAGLRVVCDDGSPVTFLPSLIRNVFRLVDVLPGLYAVGVFAILGSDRNQRLGDLAAGTLVVREAPTVEAGSMADLVASAARTPVVSLPPESAAWDVSAVTAEELSAIRAFLDRRATLAPEVRADLARTMAGRLLPKVAGLPTEQGPEAFLELLVATKATRS